MYTTRFAVRSARAVRLNTAPIRRNVRSYTDSAASSGGASTMQSPAVIGTVSGLVGGSIACYVWYQASGMASAAKTAKQAKSYVDSATNQLKSTFKDITPDANESIQFLHETANKYARWLPGGKQYVDKVFEDLEIIRKNHGDEVDNIVREAYGELRDVSKQGMNLQTMSQSWDVLSKHLQRLAGLAGDAAQDIMKNHPQLKEKFGGSFDNLKQLGDQLGPEAKKQVDETWKQVSDILKEGFSFSSGEKIYQLVQDKQQQIRKLGDQAWHKGYEQLQPMLEKNPQVKKMLEENKDMLTSGNFAELSSAVTAAVTGGNTLQLEKYIVSAKEKAESSFSSGGGLSSMLSMVPQGGKILPQLQKLQQLAQQHGQEAEQIAKDTLSEIGQVLERRSKQVEGIIQKGKQEVQREG
ncbi:hypothetical protein LTR35_016445 [Friedmanniomyces endolithicus]|uniref:Uncharacterized protein n=1 Tax=Friedmanniomyces endolithicus TaxID=329885 RepID=A0AAN6J104_9PEZI|nr:hypothetical protein LTR35_016445 [Friedmanniomyces endolithicus]KAK0273149.1 hypothetical protein LTS00_015977 [Friedmanniomyces endolithicus]KAK0305913.1 hypothetical protein LTR82_016634 [Friedmanniomyces endolithicus]KAK0977313.1 hypothetical protein LTR54_016264 [Friedmanniomyces endolithicus]